MNATTMLFRPTNTLTWDDIQALIDAKGAPKVKAPKVVKVVKSIPPEARHLSNVKAHKGDPSIRYNPCLTAAERVSLGVR